MKPIDFPGRNIIFAEDQPEYQPLPAILMPGPEAEVISCWELSDEEIAIIVKNKCLFISQLCFRHENEKGEMVNNALQPILPMAQLGDNIMLLP